MPQNTTSIELRDFVAEVDNFPKEGITFFDIAPLLRSPAAFAAATTAMRDVILEQIGQPDQLAAFDARGFLFGGPLAQQLDCGLVMLRKSGKLPGEVRGANYSLEYGQADLEVQASAVMAGEKIVLIDDVIATGGTALAGIDLLRECEAEVTGFVSLIDLPDLGGSQRIADTNVPVQALISYESEA